MDSTVNQTAGSAAFDTNYATASDASPGQSTQPSGKIDSVKQAVTSRVQAGTDWLKDRDIEQVKETLETQVREHPVRTLLVALGAGYLLGKALRR